METRRSKSSASSALSPRLVSLFLAYLSWYLPRQFHALRVAHAERFPAAAHPLIVCINHPSWWDPLTILLLSRYVAPHRFAHAPMEAEALEHYGFFRRIGAFPVDNRSPRAAAQFLRQAKEILASPQAILWMTPEGQFTDVRDRSTAWKAGSAALTRHLDACTVVPLAIEYTFWDERLPEILCLVGEPIQFSKHDEENIDARNSRLQTAMVTAQDQLTTRSIQRDASLFTTVFAGRAGVSAFYDLWQRVKAVIKGTQYNAEHGTIAPK